jgi:hypothetical protein
MRVADDRLDERVVRVMAVAIGSIFLAGIVSVAFKHPVAILGLLLLACLSIAVLRFPIFALAALLFLQPFHAAIIVALQNRADLPIGPLRYWEDVLIVVLFIRGVAQRFLKDRRLPLHNAGDNAILIYVLAFVVLAIASPSRGTVGEALVVYVEGPLIFLAIRFLRPSRKELWLCVVALMAAATVMGAVAVFERLGPHEGLLRWYGVDAGQVAYSASASPYRSASFLIDTLILAFYLAATASFSAAVATMKTRWRPVAAFGFAACTGGLICTVTRSGYIGGAVGVVMVLLMVVRNPRVRLSLVSMTLLIAGALSLHYIANGTLTRGEGDTAHKNALQRDMNLLVARPLGYGLGTTDRFRFKPGVARAGQIGKTENTYLARALEGGIQGLVLYLIALYVLLMRLRSARLRALMAGDVDGAALAAGAIGVIVAVALSGLFLGVLERVVEIVLWGAPALALTWPITARPSSPAGHSRVALPRAQP